MIESSLQADSLLLDEYHFPPQSGVQACSTTNPLCQQLRANKHQRPEILSALLGFDQPRPIVIPNQCHTANVELVSADDDLEEVSQREADALITNRQDIALCVRTADCVPILLTDNSGWIGAIHSGWRGTKGRILEKTIQAFTDQGCRAETLNLWIGPRISGEAYEVSEELADEFTTEFQNFTNFRTGRYLDIGELNLQMALKAGVPENNIFVSPLCTHQNPELFPSYRRDGGCLGEIYSAIARNSG